MVVFAGTVILGRTAGCDAFVAAMERTVGRGAADAGLQLY